MMRRCWLALGLLVAAACSCDEDPLAVAKDPCVLDEQGGFCERGRCRLIVEPGALEQITPIELTQEDAEVPISDIALGGVLCRVGPEDVSFLVPSLLTIAVEPEEITPPFLPPDRRVFVVAPPSYQILETFVAEVDRVGLRITGPITMGATLVPSVPFLAAEIGRQDYAIDDPAGYFRNLSRYPVWATFFDGRRFYLSSGPRVLIWNEGIPADPTRLPDLALGRPSLVAEGAPTSASSLGTVSGIWSDGIRLAVAAGNRVLIWNRVPTESFTPADVVLGQDGFDGDSANRGGSPGASTLAAPDDLASDGRRLLVADSANHRTLVWHQFPVLNGQPADLVIGQADFDTAEIRAGAIPMYQSRGVYLDDQRVLVNSGIGCTCLFAIDGFPLTSNPIADFTVGPINTLTKIGPTAFPRPAGMSTFGAGGLALRDSIGQRVSVWERFPRSATVAADFTLGKPDAIMGGQALFGINASALSSPSVQAGLYADDKRLIVADGTRALIWDPLPEDNFAPASKVIGQPSFTTAEVAVDYRGIGEQTLAHPAAVLEIGDRLLVADRSNNRVLIWSRTSSAAPAIVLGQGGPREYFPNRSWGPPTLSSMNGPSGLATDGARLAVVDSGNHRVLIWDRLPVSSGEPAARAIGEGELFYPSGAVFAGGALIVSDTHHHRVLIYDRLDGPATRVIGQADRIATAPNRGAGWMRPRADGLALPAGLALDPMGRLWVADRENNRVIAFTPPWSSTSAASLVIGQPDGRTTVAPNHLDVAGPNGAIELSDPQLITRDDTLRRPTGLSVAGDRLWIADSENHRIRGLPLAGGGPLALIGQSGTDRRDRNAGGLGPGSLSNPWGVFAGADTLWVADTDNHRVLGFPLAAGGTLSSTIATTVRGQLDFSANGINGSADAPGFVDRPGGLAYDGRRLWVADREHHRVLAFDAGRVELALGQIDAGRARPNGGGVPSASTLFEPADVATDGRRLVVADRNNHRVLIWNQIPSETGAPADVVIGQRDFGSNQMNAGRGPLSPDAASLLAPEGVHLDGERLFVADSGNNRVLIYEPIPTASGAAATRVLCQASFTENLGNRGSSTPSAETCSGPADARLIADQIWVADALNHRVLIFPGRADRSPAVHVIGQPGFDTREPLEGDRPSAARMNNPVAIDWDGVNLFIADRGNHRVLIYDLLPATDGAPASRVIGQVAFDVAIAGANASGLRAPAGLAAVPLGFHRTRLYISDSGSDRVVLWDGIARRGY